MLEFVCGFLLALVVIHFKEQQYTNYVHGLLAGSLLGGALCTQLFGGIDLGGMKKRSRGAEEGDEEQGFMRPNLADLFRKRV